MEERPDDLTVVRLILARQRQLGASFDAAWTTALAAIPEYRSNGRALNHAEQDRNETIAALGRTEQEWRRAYQRQPPPPPSPVPGFNIPRLPRRRQATAVSR